MKRNLASISSDYTNLYGIDFSINEEILVEARPRAFLLDILRDSYLLDEVSRNLYEDASYKIIETLSDSFSNFKKYLLKESLYISYNHYVSGNVNRTKGCGNSFTKIESYIVFQFEFFRSTNKLYSAGELLDFSDYRQHFKDSGKVENFTNSICADLRKNGYEISNDTVRSFIERRSKRSVSVYEPPEKHFQNIIYFPEFLINTDERFANNFS